MDYEETTLLLRRNLQRRLASRDLEVISFDMAVDEVTAGADHHGVVIAALILPDSLSLGSKTSTGPIRGVDKISNRCNRNRCKTCRYKSASSTCFEPNSGTSDFSL